MLSSMNDPGKILAMHLNNIYGHISTPIKIVEPPINDVNNQASAHRPILLSQIAPSNFSGPAHLKWLRGKCYKKYLNGYDFEFCPFYNMTQYEVSQRYNPYSGILGIWNDWIIEDNRFRYMRMENGDECQGKFRSTRVALLCGNTTEILNVNETATCNYLIEFSTPLVCNPDSLLVYPLLQSENQRRWNLLKGKLIAKIISEKEYTHELRRIFSSVGLIRGDDSTRLTEKSATNYCQQELESLQNKIKVLESTNSKLLNDLQLLRKRRKFESRPSLHNMSTQYN